MLPAIGRILISVIFIISAIGKLAAPATTLGQIEAAGLPFASIGPGIAIAIELGGGFMLAIGFKTRIAALLLALFTIVAGFAFHSTLADQNQLVHLLKNVAIAGGLLQVVAFGPGPLSYDLRAKGRPARQPAKMGSCGSRTRRKPVAPCQPR